MKSNTNLCSVHGEFTGDAKKHLREGHTLGDYVRVPGDLIVKYLILRADFTGDGSPYLFWTDIESLGTIIRRQKEMLEQQKSNRVEIEG